ncbi:hypothetical protein A3C23_05710 [Candidatus Roizmanbacteria bacterium RIFCSPHIGHO2_02_FULL_37_13b]|uniref:cysteine desulfurase n=1 Tax=Candidatus Roizmanbacteria bacterium RIFCSPLOWO2_02_FULL_36_11 TaxID=1802071 RepID=A0A1F7JCC9_9BACT|nr:MAG: hypothetical protein A3C23_05710 [Candidatus Roizmanbacteria bacterium RIFCSPHIGHO2_02_FULL_37_13b]OGK53264.1 MAG: hypothetical protein A3H78_03080 [Candidatus Roizmanbacteria bacterium RIFCSPLOWO2_02_FULL_36_11]
MLNTKQIKKDFPIFKNKPNLVYLDSTATALKPQSVIDKTIEYYSQYCANVTRGLYDISQKATSEFEETREVVAKFINAPSNSEIIFTRSTTEALNLLAYSLGRQLITSGDEVVTSIMEHHSNFVPWQQLAFEKKAKFNIIDITDEGHLIELDNVVTKKTKILSLTYVSNVLGTINPIKEIIKAARIINPKIVIIIDAAQAVPHIPVDVQDLGADFLAFSSHKMLGPTGVGVLWGKRKLLDNLHPFNYGGEMIEEVYIERSTFKLPPHKFEAGTPDIAGVIAFKEAIKYLSQIGMKKVQEHEISMTKYTLKRLNQEFGGEIKVLGPKNASDKDGVITFTLNKIHAHDIAEILNNHYICIRAGHHCAIPLHFRLQLKATSRASFYIYNDEDDVEKLIEGLKKVKKILS